MRGRPDACTVPIMARWSCHEASTRVLSSWQFHVTIANMKTARPYVMTTRAETAAATGERILEAALEVFWESPTDQIVLTDVAERAGVSVQTIIRRYGGKEGLMAAAGAREAERIATQRGNAPTGDPAAALRILMDHYEEMGDRVLRMLAAGATRPGLAPLIDLGRQTHRDWCAAVFADALRRRRGAARTRLLAQLVAVCDVQTWHTLRRVCDLSRTQTERALTEMVSPLLH